MSTVIILNNEKSLIYQSDPIGSRELLYLGYVLNEKSFSEPFKSLEEVKDWIDEKLKIKEKIKYRIKEDNDEFILIPDEPLSPMRFPDLFNLLSYFQIKNSLHSPHVIKPNPNLKIDVLPRERR